MKVNKGDRLKVIDNRKGTFYAIANSDFDTEDEWYDVLLDQEYLAGLNNVWCKGEKVPARKGISNIEVIDRILNKRPIFRFDLIQDTGGVKTVTITNYTNHPIHDYVYDDPDTGVVKYIDKKDFNNFSSGRVYLHENNKAEALKIIRESLENRLSNTYASYVRAMNLYNMFDFVTSKEAE